MYSCGRFQSCTVILYLFIIELKKIQSNNPKEFTIRHMLGAKTIGANNEFWGKKLWVAEFGMSPWNSGDKFGC